MRRVRLLKGRSVSMYHKFHVIELMVLNVLGKGVGFAKGRKAFVSGMSCAFVYRHQCILYRARSLWSETLHHECIRSKCIDSIYEKGTNCQTWVIAGWLWRNVLRCSSASHASYEYNVFDSKCKIQSQNQGLCASSGLQNTNNTRLTRRSTTRRPQQKISGSKK
jgi:hypothetical protein